MQYKYIGTDEVLLMDYNVIVKENDVVTTDGDNVINNPLFVLVTNDKQVPKASEPVQAKEAQVTKEGNI